MLSNGNCAIIKSVKIIEIVASQTTYNFEVADFHTYYVSDSKVLVHNLCAQAYLDEALNRQGLDGVPQGGFKERWIEGNYKIEVRAHAGNSEFTNAKQIFRVSRRPLGGGKSTMQYLGSDNIWYGMSVLKPSSPSFSSAAAALTHIPVP